MTAPFITSLILLAGICVGFGILYLFMGWRRAQEQLGAAMNEALAAAQIWLEKTVPQEVGAEGEVQDSDE